MKPFVGVDEFVGLFEEKIASKPLGEDVVAHPFDEEEPGASFVDVVFDGVDLGGRVIWVVEGGWFEVVGWT